MCDRRQGVHQSCPISLRTPLREEDTGTMDGQLRLGVPCNPKASTSGRVPTRCRNEKEDCEVPEKPRDVREFCEDRHVAVFFLSPWECGHERECIRLSASWICLEQPHLHL